MSAGTAATIDELAALEQRLKAKADQGFPESWKPNPGDELTVRVAKYSEGFDARGQHQGILVFESLKAPGNFRSLWLLHTTLRNEVNRKKPMPGEVIYLRYEGLVNPKHGGDPYHGWRLEVDRDETTNPSYLPWASEPATRDTVADQMTPTDTGPPAQPGDGAPVGESFYTTTASDDDIPF